MSSPTKITLLENTGIRDSRSLLAQFAGKTQQALRFQGLVVEGLGLVVHGVRASSAPASPERGNSKALYLTGPRPKGINVETFRIDYLIRTPKGE